MAAGITLGEAKEVFEQQVSCFDNPRTLYRAVTAAIEFVMLNGGGDILREWTVIVRDGKFTFPRDLQTPIKYKFARLPHAGFGTIHSPYFSYSSNAIKSTADYLKWGPEIEIKANKVGSQYSPPRGGVILTATTTTTADLGKKILVSGSYKRNPVLGVHNGFKTAGELLTLHHPDDTQKTFSTFAFDEITAVTKDKTNGWVMLAGLRDQKYHLLSYYHPDDETVQYIQGEMFNGMCPTDCDVCLHILGRVNPSIRYSRDEDVLPISSVEMLEYLAKRYRYREGGDLNEEAAMEQRIRNLIRQQVSYQEAAHRSTSVQLAGSGYTLTNV